MPADHWTEVRKSSIENAGNGLFARVQFFPMDYVAILELVEKRVTGDGRVKGQIYYKVKGDTYAAYYNGPQLVARLKKLRKEGVECTVGAGATVNSAEFAKDANVRFAKASGNTVAIIAIKPIKEDEEILAFYKTRGGSFEMREQITEPEDGRTDEDGDSSDSDA